MRRAVGDWGGALPIGRGNALCPRNQAGQRHTTLSACGISPRGGERWRAPGRHCPPDARWRSRPWRLIKNRPKDGCRADEPPPPKKPGEGNSELRPIGCVNDRCFSEFPSPGSFGGRWQAVERAQQAQPPDGWGLAGVASAGANQPHRVSSLYGGGRVPESVVTDGAGIAGPRGRRSLRPARTWARVMSCRERTAWPRRVP